MRTVLDADALNALLHAQDPAERQVRRTLEAARRLRRGAWVASVTLAELHRGAGRSRSIDALLAREMADGVRLRDTDRGFARLVVGAAGGGRGGRRTAGGRARGRRRRRGWGRDGARRRPSRPVPPGGALP